MLKSKQYKTHGILFNYTYNEKFKYSSFIPYAKILAVTQTDQNMLDIYIPDKVFILTFDPNTDSDLFANIMDKLSEYHEKYLTNHK